MATLAGTQVGYSHYPSCPPLQSVCSHAQPGNNLLACPLSQFYLLDTTTLGSDTGSLALISPSLHISLTTFYAESPLPTTPQLSVDPTSRCEEDPLSLLLKLLSAFSSSPHLFLSPHIGHWSTPYHIIKIILHWDAESSYPGNKTLT